MDFQAINSYGTRVNGPTDEDVDTEKTIFHKGTPNSSISDFNWEELLHLVDQNQGGGFSGDTVMDATLSWQVKEYGKSSILHKYHVGNS